LNFFDPCKSAFICVIRGKGWVLVQNFCCEIAVYAKIAEIAVSAPG
jgi:hypothetical protein